MTYSCRLLSVLFLLVGLCSCSQKDSTPTTIPVTAITLNPTSLSLSEGESADITASISPNNASNQKVIWSSSDASVASVSGGKVTGIAKGTATISAIADDNGKEAKCTVTVNAKSGGGNSGTGNTPEAVDLGLSVKWASFNLGASKPEGYGDFYAWGETKTKDYYSWSNYSWCKGSKTTLTKYNTDSSYGTVDNKTTLSAEDDAAHVKLGGDWRIPTKAEWKELYSECHWQWTTYNLVAGYLVSGPNGNSIFLPAAGAFEEDELYLRGEYMYYQSSSLFVDEPTWAYQFKGKQDANNHAQYIEGYSREIGVSIRPVYGAPKIDEPDEPEDQYPLSITVSGITASECNVTISTQSSDTYYIGIIEKSTWDEYDATYVCDYYIKEDLNAGVLNQYLNSGKSTTTWTGLKTKTAYVVFAAYCNSDGKRNGHVYHMIFTSK